MEDRDKKLAFLENLLTKAENDIKGLIMEEGRKNLRSEGKVIFVSDSAPMDEGCHIYLKLDEKDRLFFHVKKTMHYKSRKLSEWDSKDCISAKEALEYAQRYLPNNYEKFVKEVYLDSNALSL